MEYEELQKIMKAVAYLRQTAGAGTDEINEYLDQKYGISGADELVQLVQAARPPAPQGEQFGEPGIPATAVEHLGAGGALGWSAQLSGLMDAIGEIGKHPGENISIAPGGMPGLNPASPNAPEIGAAYQGGVEENQGYQAASARANPKTALAARITGTALPFAISGGAPAAIGPEAISPFLGTTARTALRAGVLGGVESASQVPEDATPGQAAGQIGKGAGLNAAFAGAFPLVARGFGNFISKPALGTIENTFIRVGGPEKVKEAGQVLFDRTGIRPTLAEAMNEATRINSARAAGIAAKTLTNVESPAVLELRGLMRKFPDVRADVQALAQRRVLEAEHALQTAASVEQKEALQVLLQQRRQLLAQSQRVARGGAAGGASGATGEAVERATSKVFSSIRTARNLSEWLSGDFEQSLAAIEGGFATGASTTGQALGGAAGAVPPFTRAKKRGLFDIPGY